MERPCNSLAGRLLAPILLLVALNGCALEIMGSNGVGGGANNPSQWTRADESGSGVSGDPYLIYNETQMLHLMETPSFWGDEFLMMNDIDLQSIYLAGAEDVQIGDCGASHCASGDEVSFTGVFDGGNFTISNFVFDDNTQSGPGLFARVDGGGIVKQLSLADSTSIGSVDCGGIVGWADDVLSDLNYVDGVVTCVGNNAGGVAGVGAAVITNVTSTGSRITGNLNVGGVVGSGASIIGARSDNVVFGFSQVGGVAGTGTITLSAAFATSLSHPGNAQVQGTILVGGLVGRSDIVSLSYSTVDSVWSSDGWLGGLVGGSFGNLSVIDCYSTSPVTNTAPTVNGTGGLAGHATITITISDSYSTGDVDSPQLASGGFAGAGIGAVTDSYTTSSILNAGFGAGFGGVNSNCHYTHIVAAGNCTQQSADPVTARALATAGWDFVNKWVVVPGDDPVLKDVP